MQVHIISFVSGCTCKAIISYHRYVYARRCDLVKRLLTSVVLGVGVVRAEWAWEGCLSAEGALEGEGQSPRSHKLEDLLSHQHPGPPI